MKRRGTNRTPTADSGGRGRGWRTAVARSNRWDQVPSQSSPGYMELMGASGEVGCYRESLLDGDGDVW